MLLELQIQEPHLEFKAPAESFARLDRGVNYSLEISGNPYKKSEISYA